LFKNGFRHDNVEEREIDDISEAGGHKYDNFGKVVFHVLGDDVDGIYDDVDGS